MRVLLISANTERMNILPLPLGTAFVAAAARRAGHDAILLDLMFAGDAQSAIQNCIGEFRPDVIGISVRNIDDQNMADPKFLLPPVREVVTACRNLCDAPIIVGGAGYSIFPESALRYLGADMGVQGDGETVFPALLDRLAKGTPVDGLTNLYLPGQRPTSRTFASHINDLPLPEPDLWIPNVSGKGDFWIPIQGKRGCPMVCSFCSTKDIQGRATRSRSAEAIVGWLGEFVSRGFQNFVFVDSTFNIPPAYAKEVCRAIIKGGLDLNLWCIIYPKWMDRELVELMAQANCREVSLGFEAASDQMLKTYNKRFKAEEVRAISRMFADAGIRRMGFLLLGGPGETRKTVEESLAFADSLHLDALKITVGLRIYPATALAATALAEGIIRPDDDLLWPRFYLAPRLRDWLPERIAAYQSARSWVM